MAKRAKSLKTRFGAYYQREVPREDTELTHVGPGTPCGEYLRRFWQPVGLSAELADLPRRIRIMGEDLVLFRDLQRRVGLLQLHCSHRGTSLEFGRLTDRGIMCCYHGWEYAVDGTVVATPGEPADSPIKERLCHGAYPTHEYSGLVFAFMGPPDKQPPFPIYDTFDLPGYQLLPGTRNVLPCNWVQIKENCMDPVHTVFLHTVVSGTQFTEAFREIGTLDWMETPVGMVYIHTRRVGELVWVHMNDFLPPNIHQFPPTWESGQHEKTFQRPMMTNWSVPIDDEVTMNLGFRHFNERMTETERRSMEARRGVVGGEGFGQTGDRPYEDRQRVPGDYDAQVGQRPIAVHALEHLGATDRGISMLRRIVKDGVAAVKRGEDPKHLCREDGKVLLTYSNDTIMRIPRCQTAEEENRLLLTTGRRIAEGLLKSHPLACAGLAAADAGQ
jgi:phenylpropionate dioxygenase-like ring-hydroxylating dioxygenase large terminal subunit